MIEYDFKFIYDVSIILIFFISLAFPKRDNALTTLISLILIFIGAYLIGHRGTNIGVDTIEYEYMYNDAVAMDFKSLKSQFFEIASEPIFFIILKVGSYIGTFNFILFVISVLTLLSAYHFCIKLSKLYCPVSALSILCCYLMAFYIYGQQVNIIRAGLAMTLILNFYIYLFEGNKKYAIIFAILACGVHFTGIICISIALAVRYIKIPKQIFILIFTLCLILSFANLGILNIPIISNIDLGKKSMYLSGGSMSYTIGFRWGFAIYNTVFYLIFNYILKDKKLGLFLLHIYALLSSIFFLSFQIPYSDRIGGMSWNLIPFLTLLCALQLINRPKNATLYAFILMLTVNYSI